MRRVIVLLPLGVALLAIFQCNNETEHCWTFGNLSCCDLVYQGKVVDTECSDGGAQDGGDAAPQDAKVSFPDVGAPAE